MDDDMTEEEALREAFMQLLLALPAELLKTEERRGEIADSYEVEAQHSHPAVAEVLREAAERVRGTGNSDPV